MAARIDQRAAGIAGVQGGVGLNDILDQAARVRAQRPAQCADHARCYGRLKSIRIANGNRHLARPQLLRISQRDGLQSSGIDSNNGEIGGRIIANRVSRCAPSIRETDFDSGGIVHHVAVRENQAIGRKDEAGATAASFPWFTRTTAARGWRGLMDLHVYDRRTYQLHCGGHRMRIGVEQGGVTSFG